MSIEHRGVGLWPLWIILGLLIAISIGMLATNQRPRPALDTRAQSTGTGPQSSNTDSPFPAGSPQWIYSQSPDPMGKGTTYTAMIQSTNTVTFDFPYGGSQHAKLILRTHPRHGKDVLLRLERGQFLCTSYDGCSVLVRFDDGEARRFSAAPPSDNSTETLFIQNYSRFVAGMLKARRVRISAEVYQEGSPVFDFDVSGFETARYRPPGL